MTDRLIAFSEGDISIISLSTCLSNLRLTCYELLYFNNLHLLNLKHHYIRLPYSNSNSNSDHFQSANRAVKYKCFITDGYPFIRTNLPSIQG